MKQIERNDKFITSKNRQDLPNHSDVGFEHGNDNVAVEFYILDDELDGALELFQVAEDDERIERVDQGHGKAGTRLES